MPHIQLNSPAVHASAWSAKNLDWFSSSLGSVAGANGALFANVLASIDPGTSSSATPGTPTDASSASDPVSQILALVQNGTPPSTIAQTIAQRIIDNYQQHIGTLTTAQQDGIRKSIETQVERDIGGSPPTSNAPPLKLPPLKLGQQNDIAGNILDAKSAKDIPAQAQVKETSSKLDVSSLVHSSIAQALTSLLNVNPAAVQSLTKPASLPSRIAAPILSGPAANAPGAVRIEASSLPSASTSTPDHQQQPSSNVPSSLAAASAGDANDAISMQNAPDLLARMLVRASATDARLNGNAQLSSVPQAPQAAGGTQSPQVLAARFEAAIATIVSNAVASNASNGSSTSNGQSQNLLDQSTQAAPTSNDLSSTTAVSQTLPTFSNLVQTIAQQPQSHVPVDANAVIEQMMKSMVMRTNDQGTSTIRLHLQPENLGDMTMHITVSGSQISANVVASSADVRSALISSHQQLARSLQNAGLTLSGFSVDVSGGNTGRDQHRDRTSGFGRRYVVHELHGPTTQDTPALSTLAPSIASGTSLELFNYLV